ncbi:FtsX-like permease family protein [Noviherbaspirillum autotrophicum]|uniref:Multidrug ABC transporter substrate-binding protein n=1 Tax=Noviherbaspirillum autotrophicum TaxID=709839 RepID=A0A0C2BI94_9BURK|nr:FtsX-like permease family protein [Noviherbaspirillum autotrophicum]KIF80915.1 multidrug ABC transporter substrate-binding protein [Noviherbaspirillum autotrophicum]
MTGTARSRLRLNRWLMLGEWRAHPGRALVAMLAIALGVALGFAIHLINAAAFNEFSAAARSLSGQADLQVRGAQAFFDESLYAQLAQHDGVALANPVLELDATVPGREGALKLLGIDPLRAARIAPDLIGVPAPNQPFDTLADDTIFLSPAAMAWLQVRQGDILRLQSGTAIVPLRVAGSIAHARPGQRIAVMDIGAAQWRFNRLGLLSRIDLKLTSGIERSRFRQALAGELGSCCLLSEPQDQDTRTANMSRAYRVNLNVLALVALFTGAFLVFSTQALSVIRRRSQLALLRVLGLTRRQLLAQILLEGAALGVAGSLLGLAAGYAMAAAALRLFGGDLGGGYFPGVQPAVQFSPLAALAFFGLGNAVALLGCASPAWEAARARPAAALKTGSEDVALSRLASPWPGLVCIALALGLTQAPAVFELPVFGYLAVALLLVGGIALMPRAAALLFSWAAAAAGKRKAEVVPILALARLSNAPNQASIALGGVLSSFSLMVAMAIMVASFRISVDDWLSHLLSADLYVRSASGGATGALRPQEQSAIAATQGVARAAFLRSTQLALDPDRPPVALIARPIDAARPEATLPIIGATLPAQRIPRDAIPVWASEAMLDLYGYRVGMQVRLPLAGRTVDALVAGVWRDYARQSGAIQMRLVDYRTLTGDSEVNDAALWLQAGSSVEQVEAALRRLPFGAALEFAEPGEIRAISLKIFDRSFAVTYLLELVAIVIGLFGVAATFSAQTLARAKEFGMLRHVGVTRRQILAMLAAEGGALTLLGIAAGFVLGGAISLILVYVVNPQSFHWTMQLHVPWSALAAVALLLLAASALTALVAGRYAVSDAAVRAVREDW